MQIVVGMCGMPVKNGIGVRQPLIQDTHDGTYLGTAENRYEEEKVQSLVEQGLLTKLNLGFPQVREGWVVAYVDEEFLHIPGGLDLGFTSSFWGRVLLGSQPFWVAYMPLQMYQQQCDRWRARCFARARSLLKLNPAASVELLLRARFCLDTQQNPRDGYRFFWLMADAHRALGRPVDAVLSDAKIDFPNLAETLVAEPVLRECPECCKKLLWPGRAHLLEGRLGWVVLRKTGKEICPRCAKTSTVMR